MKTPAHTAEIRLTVAKLLELSYRKKEGLTSQLVRERGNLKLTVSQNGSAMLSGKAGTVAFSASEAIQTLGVSVKAITILMSVDGNGAIQYNASFRLGVSTLLVKGSVDVEILISTCSGILCRAARAMKGRPAQLDRDFQNALGN